MVLMAAFILLYSYQREQAAISEASVGRVRGMVSALDRELARTEATLVTLSTGTLILDNDLEHFHARALRALNNMRVDSIEVLDASGQLLMTTRRPYGTPLPKLSRPPLLARTIATGKPGVSDLFASPTTGKPVITIGVPVKDKNDTVVASLNAVIDPSQLGGILHEQNLPEGWRVSIFDGSGHVVARTHEIEKYLGKSAPPRLKKHMAQQREGSFDGVSLDGIPAFTAFSRSALNNWAVVMGVPRAELIAESQRRLLWLVLFASFALGVGLIYAWRIGGKIAAAVTALKSPAQMLGDGRKFTPPSHSHIPEVDDVAQSLVIASGRLHAALEEDARSRIVLQRHEANLVQAQRVAKIGNWIIEFDTDNYEWSEELYRIVGRSHSIPPIDVTNLSKYFTTESWDALVAVYAQVTGGFAPFNCDAELIKEDGNHVWVGITGELIRDTSGRLSGVRGTVQDISERKDMDVLRRQEEHSRYLSLHDSLTGLPNRALFQDRLSHGIRNAERSKAQLGLMFIDLDHFKQINDTLGHHAGDVLLKEIAGRLSKALRKSDTVARFGGDEFVVLLQDVKDRQSCYDLAQKLIEQVTTPVVFGDETMQLSASIGIAIFPQDAQDAYELIKNADTAMYKAKWAGRNNFQHFSVNSQNETENLPGPSKNLKLVQ